MRVRLTTRSTQRLTILAAAVAVMAACSLLPMRLDDKATAPTLDGFGASSLQPAKANEAARRLFAQGMAQVYAFNEAEAIRAFKAALAQDPDCALCAWGVAYQMGPNINNTERGDLRPAVWYVDYARAHDGGASARETALIESLALRYGHHSGGAPTAAAAVPKPAVCTTGGAAATPPDPLDVAYAARMQKLVARFPGDPDILAIYAEAELVATTDPWWDAVTGKPAGNVGELATLLEQGLALHPGHVGLNHYMIHTVDAVQVAGRAEAAADRLGALAPKSPHLLHMPSHTYAQLGRYADATRVNQQAVAADEAMALDLKRQQFADTKDWRGHNRHFQWYGALMEGRGELALATARASAEHAKGSSEYSEYVRSLPMITLLHLQRWDALAKEPMPRGDKGLATVLGNMAHGIAQARSGQLAAAKASQAQLDPAAAALLKQHVGSGFIDKLVRSLVDSAQAQLQAELALAGHHDDDAIAQQAKAVTAAREADTSEPPMLAGGPRQRLGLMQMQARQYAGAEQSYRADLALHPHSGWALLGLGKALAAQGKQADAQAVAGELARSWPLADASLRTLN